MADKAEFPPLLAPGFYVKTIAELRTLCVDSFPLSNTRTQIMDGLERFVGILASHQIVGDLWVDGSFLTEKIDPEDVDVVLCMQSLNYESGTVEQQQTIDMVSSEDLKKDFLCDSYVFYEYPTGDPLYMQGVWDHGYWLRQYGFSRGLDYKGIVVLQLR